MLWHNVWLECGRPRDDFIADIMRRTRAAYHYAVRYIKKNNSDIVKQRFASAIVENFIYLLLNSYRTVQHLNEK